MMNEEVKSFVRAVKDQVQLQSLLESADLRVSLITEEETIQLLFKNGKVSAIYEPGLEPTMNRIYGEPTELIRLLEGKERLRTLQKSGLIKVSATLRTTLLLESIFYLAKPRNALVS
jgi:hypothetical protein